MIVPTRTQRRRGGRRVETISTNGALTDLAASVGGGKSYAAAQTSWAAWCQARLDPSIERGTPKAQTGRAHLLPEAYGAAKDEVRALKERAAAKLKTETARAVAEARRRAEEAWGGRVAAVRRLWASQAAQERQEAVATATAPLEAENAVLRLQRDQERDRARAAEERARHLADAVRHAVSQRNEAWERDRALEGRSRGVERPAASAPRGARSA